MKMAKFTHNNKHIYSTKSAVVLFLIGFLGFAFIADYMWFSSSSFSSAYHSIASNWALQKSGITVVPNVVDTTSAHTNQVHILILCIEFVHETD